MLELLLPTKTKSAIKLYILTFEVALGSLGFFLIILGDFLILPSCHTEDYHLLVKNFKAQ